jgi:hypothetical protein
VWELNDVMSIEYRGGFTFHIVFDDGLDGDVEFTEYLGRGLVFESVKNQALFRKARIERGAIAWPGTADRVRSCPTLGSGRSKPAVRRHNSFPGYARTEAENRRPVSG